MGSQNSMHLIEHPLPKDYKCDPSNPNLYVSLINQVKLQKHLINITNKQDLQYQQQMFIFRKCHSDHLIAAKYFQNLSFIEYCSKNYQVCYYTQYPQYRLNQIYNISFYEGLLYLIDSLKGFSILSKKVGWFRVNDRMIVLDHLHKVKVWLSDNSSQTKLSKQAILKTQTEFVTKIVSVFDSKVTNIQNCYSNLLSKNISHNAKTSINTCLNILIKLVEQNIQENNLSTNRKVFQKKQSTPKFNHKNSKNQTSFKRNKKSQQSIIALLKNVQNNNNYFITNQTNHQTMKNHISNNNLNNCSTFNHLQTTLNYSETFRQKKKTLSHQKQIVIQNKKFRKSMDQYQIHKTNINKLMSHHITHQKVHQLIANPPKDTNHIPYLHISENKLQQYQRCLTKNKKEYKYDNPQVTQKYIHQNDRQSLAINMKKIQKNNSQSQSVLQPNQNIIKSNLINSNTILNTIKSINYSDVGNQQKSQSVIIYNKKFNRKFNKQ